MRASLSGRNEFVVRVQKQFALAIEKEAEQIINVDPCIGIYPA
jgi:hypothetical protein